MLAYRTVRRVILGTGDPAEKKVRFMALLTASLPKQSPRPVLVGGSAIEVYLDGMLRTGDMDVVHPIREMERVLRAWKFSLGEGLRAWVNDELALAVDMVGSDFIGSRERVTTITTPYGPATVIGVEDLILRRVASAKHWRVPADMEQAYLLAKAFDDRIDWAYLEEEAKKVLIADYLKKLRKSLSGGSRKAGRPTVRRRRGP